LRSASRRVQCTSSIRSLVRGFSTAGNVT